MTAITFAKAFRRHVDCPDDNVDGATVGDALDDYFARHPAVRSYVLDDEGSLRRHVTVFVDGDQVDHLRGPATAVGDTSVIHLFQALSGG